MSQLPTKAVLEADLLFITTVLDAIDHAAKVRQHTLHLPHPDYLSVDLKQARTTLSLKAIGLKAALTRMELLGK